MALTGLLRPDLIILEMFPFGRRAFAAELQPLLQLRPKPVTLSSVRDILVSRPDPRRQAAVLELARDHVDAVLVHGDARLFPFEESFPPAPALGDRLVYTGFVLDQPTPLLAGSAPAVLVSAGGGAVGERLLDLALRARPLSSMADRPWLFVAGSQLPQERLTALGSLVVRHRADLPALLGAAEVSVSQAGYNTVVEGLAGAARMVLVPYAAGGEDEQTRRASALDRLGLATHLPEAGLQPAALAAAIDAASTRARPDKAPIRFDGAERTAEIAARLLHRHDA